MDQQSGRANEQNDQGRDCKTLPLRNPQLAANAARGLLGSLQLRPKAQDADRPHALELHLQNLDIKAKSIHPKSDPPDAGTEHLSRPPDYGLHHKCKVHTCSPISLIDQVKTRLSWDTGPTISRICFLVCLTVRQ